MSTEEKIAEQRAAHVLRAGRWFDFLVRGKHTDFTWAESPIERLALAGLLANGWSLAIAEEHEACRGRLKELSLVAAAIFSHSTNGSIGLQVQCDLSGKPVRFDAVCLLRDAIGASRVVVIELDGHDFHERTKAQASRDRARDRAVTLRGWTPIRFTGSEVYASPACVHQFLNRVVTGNGPEPA